MTTVTNREFESLIPGLFGRRRKDSDVEEVGLIRRMIQDVLVPEMQGIKERLAAHDEKFVAIERRLDVLERTMTEGFAAIRQAIERIDARLERIEGRLQFMDFDKRLYRLEVMLERGAGGPKSTAA